jgi:tetratricopeptide (TPR) repeat protein
LLERCLELYRRLGNELEVAATLSTLSLARLQAGDATAAEAGEREALELFRSLGEKSGEATGLLHLGQIAVYVGNAELAKSSLEQCLAIAREIEDREAEGEAELVLGENAFLSGDLPQARVHLERSLGVCRDAGDRRGEARALYWLGKVDLEFGVIGAARPRLGSALIAFRDFEMREQLVDCLESHAELAKWTGDVGLAAQLAGAVQSYRERLDLMRSPRAQVRWRQGLEALVSVLGKDRFEEAWQMGSANELGDALARALTLTGDGGEGPANSRVHQRQSTSATAQQAQEG